MERRIKNVWRSRIATGALAFGAVVLLTQCNKSSTAPIKVAATNVKAPVTASTVAAITGKTFTIPNGGAALTPALANQTIAVTFAASGATTTASFSLPNTGGSFTANTTFGSCIFTVTSVNNAPGVVVGAVYTVNPCDVNVGTAGQATGSTANSTATVSFGTATSQPVSVAVTVSPTGVVTIGGTTVGTTTVTNSTGGA